MTHSALWLLLLVPTFILLVDSTGATPTILYVKPTEDAQCPCEPCCTLEWYVRNNFTQSNTVMSFLPGTHNLNTSYEARDISNLTLIAAQTNKTCFNTSVIFNTTAQTDKPIVNCLNNFSLEFIDISNLTIKGLTIYRCFNLSFQNINNLHMFQVSINHSLGGLTVCNLFGNCSFEEMYIESSTYTYPTMTVFYDDNQLPLPHSAFSMISITHSTFRHLLAPAALYIDLNHRYNIPVSVTIRNTSFTNIYSLYQFGTGVVYLSNTENVTFIDCEFTENKDTPLYAYNSVFTFSGTITFRNNTAYKGGAIVCIGNSHIILSNNSNIVLIYNSAQRVGGAVFVEQITRFRLQGEHEKCFFVLQTDIHSCDQFPTLNVTISFINNTANTGGDAIYGAFLSDCVVAGGCRGYQLLKYINFQPSKDSDLSLISSDPTLVCLCTSNGTVNCTKNIKTCYKLEQPHYPGEEFYIPAVAIGDQSGTVDGAVYAHLVTQGEFGEDFQRVQHVSRNGCTNLTYSILTDAKMITLVLTTADVTSERSPGGMEKWKIQQSRSTYGFTGQISSDRPYTPVQVDITLLPCPLGFKPSSFPSECVCDPQLRDINVTCNITDQRIYRSGTTWVNASFEGNTSNGVIISKYCPYNYCKLKVVAVNLEHPDFQCAFNHSGIICGACQPGLSLTLGHSQCLPCSNKYLALLIAFGIAGVALVFFIKVLNLTVAVGSVNSLIFYANIVRASDDIFFPAGDTNPLTIFIAWVNLDLGIKTCFFDGLNGYWKTWLQFVFPLYIWSIIILTILLSRRYAAAAKIFGNNSVPVLATLILLSYAKLLRTIITVLTFTLLELPHGSRRAVWSFDGNIEYLSSAHLPLFLVAIGVLLFLWLPYTVLLVSTQAIHRITNYRVRQWMLKLKPFLDAYFAPMKHKHCYWVGVLLLVRGILFLVFAVTPSISSNIDLLATIIAICVLFGYLAYAGRVYQKSYLTLLEIFDFVNLGVLAAGTLYVRLTNGNQAALVYTCVGLVFTQFAAILLFHALTAVKPCCPWIAIGEARGGPVRAEYQDLNNSQDGEEFNVSNRMNSSGDFRESLLKYADSEDN